MSEPPPRPTHPGARMVGEAYKDHSDRAFGMLRAAEVDLAAARAELLRRAELCHIYAEHIAAVRAVLGIAEGADASGSESADVHKIQQLQDDLGMEMGMRTAAIDQLETLRRHLWALVDGDQLSDDDTVERLRAALTTAEIDHG